MNNNLFRSSIETKISIHRSNNIFDTSIEKNIYNKFFDSNYRFITSTSNITKQFNVNIQRIIDANIDNYVTKHSLSSNSQKFIKYIRRRYWQRHVNMIIKRFRFFWFIFTNIIRIWINDSKWQKRILLKRSFFYETCFNFNC